MPSVVWRDTNHQKLEIENNRQEIEMNMKISILLLVKTLLSFHLIFLAKQLKWVGSYICMYYFQVA